jgi:hypothetical protein
MEAIPAVLNYFVYFRLRDGLDADDVSAGIRAMQASLARDTGVSGRLMRRRDDAATWMEIYEGVADAATFEQALSRTVAAHDLERLIEPGSARHMERFLECA